MKISRHFFGYLLIALFWLFSGYCTVSYFTADCLKNCEKWDEVLDLPRYIYNLYILWSICFAVGFIVIIVLILDSKNKTVFTIPNPFVSMAEAYKQRRAYLKEINNIYHKIAESDNETEIDFLVKKKEIIEKRLNTK